MSLSADEIMINSKFG